jgi:hypothetical protein
MTTVLQIAVEAEAIKIQNISWDWLHAPQSAGQLCKGTKFAFLVEEFMVVWIIQVHWNRAYTWKL